MVRVTSVGLVVAFAVLITKTNFAAGEDSENCYDELGCFPAKEPWWSLSRPFPAPQSPTEINTRIFCYTRDAPDTSVQVTLWPTVSLNGLPFSTERPTVIITHGFYSSINESWVEDMKDAYLDQVDANVCKMDWSEGADTINYLQVAANTRVAGAELARFLRFLQSEYGLLASSLHLIGHSLGSHVCGIAAKNVTGVNRITGLDVAQPGFEGYNDTTRLVKSDAQFVDVVHTNAAAFFPNRGLGSVEPLGHVDFYMNNGRRQPGCLLVSIMSSALSLLSSLSDLGSTAASALIEWSGCSHGRSFEYFTASLRKNCSIWGQSSTMNFIRIFRSTTVQTELSECTVETCVPLGLHTPAFPATGVFTANTAEDYPYCMSAEDNNVVVNSTLSNSEGLSDSLIEIVKSFWRVE